MLSFFFSFLFGVPGQRTAIHKMVDLVFGHAGAFSRTEGLFLFLSPFIDIMEILGVAVIVNDYLTGYGNDTHI